MLLSIRNENESDFRKVEELTREAFWNLFVPGCNEHYLAHILRTHPDFIKELDFVAIHENEIIGNIMYAKSHIIDESGKKTDTITFGPVSVLPKYQRQNVGSQLIEHSIKIATVNNYKVIIIQGHPGNYCRHGFKSSKDFMLSDSEGRYPYSFLVLELEKGILQGHSWKYYSSSAYEIDENAAEEFDRQFDFKKKEFKHTQEAFSIACRAYLV